jgi:hypothetical protein
VYLRTTQIERTVESMRGLVHGMYGPRPAGSEQVVLAYSVPVAEEHFFPNARTCPRAATIFKDGRAAFHDPAAWTPHTKAVREAVARLLTDADSSADAVAPEQVNFVKLRDMMVATQAHGEPLSATWAQPCPGCLAEGKAPPRALSDCVGVLAAHQMAAFIVHNNSGTVTPEDLAAEGITVEGLRLSVGRMLEEIALRLEQQAHAHALANLDEGAALPAWATEESFARLSAALTTQSYFPLATAGLSYSAPSGGFPVPRLCLYAAHDSTLMSLLQALGVYEEGHWPAFGSHVTLELVAVKDEAPAAPAAPASASASVGAALGALAAAAAGTEAIPDSLMDEDLELAAAAAAAAALVGTESAAAVAGVEAGLSGALHRVEHAVEEAVHKVEHAVEEAVHKAVDAEHRAAAALSSAAGDFGREVGESLKEALLDIDASEFPELRPDPTPEEPKPEEKEAAVSAAPTFTPAELEAFDRSMADITTAADADVAAIGRMAGPLALQLGALVEQYFDAVEKVGFAESEAQVQAAAVERDAVLQRIRAVVKSAREGEQEEEALAAASALVAAESVEKQLAAVAKAARAEAEAVAAGEQKRLSDALAATTAQADASLLSAAVVAAQSLVGAEQGAQASAAAVQAAEAARADAKASASVAAQIAQDAATEAAKAAGAAARLAAVVAAAQVDARAQVAQAASESQGAKQALVAASAALQDLVSQQQKQQAVLEQTVTASLGELIGSAKAQLEALKADASEALAMQSALTVLGSAEADAEAAAHVSQLETGLEAGLDAGLRIALAATADQQAEAQREHQEGIMQAIETTTHVAKVASAQTVRAAARSAEASERAETAVRELVDTVTTSTAATADLKDKVCGLIMSVARETIGINDFMHKQVGNEVHHVKRAVESLDAATVSAAREVKDIATELRTALWEVRALAERAITAAADAESGQKDAALVSATSASAQAAIQVSRAQAETAAAEAVAATRAAEMMSRKVNAQIESLEAVSAQAVQVSKDAVDAAVREAARKSALETAQTIESARQAVEVAQTLAATLIEEAEAHAIAAQAEAIELILSAKEAGTEMAAATLAAAEVEAERAESVRRQAQVARAAAEEDARVLNKRIAAEREAAEEAIEKAKATVVSSKRARAALAQREKAAAIAAEEAVTMANKDAEVSIARIRRETEEAKLALERSVKEAAETAEAARAAFAKAAAAADREARIAETAVEMNALRTAAARAEAAEAEKLAADTKERARTLLEAASFAAHAMVDAGVAAGGAMAAEASTAAPAALAADTYAADLAAKAEQWRAQAAKSREEAAAAALNARIEAAVDSSLRLSGYKHSAGNRTRMLETVKSMSSAAIERFIGDVDSKVAAHEAAMAAVSVPRDGEDAYLTTLGAPIASSPAGQAAIADMVRQVREQLEGSMDKIIPKPPATDTDTWAPRSGSIEALLAGLGLEKKPAPAAAPVMLEGEQGYSAALESLATALPRPAEPIKTTHETVAHEEPKEMIEEAPLPASALDYLTTLYTAKNLVVPEQPRRQKAATAPEAAPAPVPCIGTPWVDVYKYASALRAESGAASSAHAAEEPHSARAEHSTAAAVKDLTASLAYAAAFAAKFGLAAPQVPDDVPVPAVAGDADEAKTSGQSEYLNLLSSRSSGVVAHSADAVSPAASTRYYVRVRYNGQSVAIPGCVESKGDLCALESFRDILAHFMHADYAEECGLPSFNGPQLPPYVPSLAGYNGSLERRKQATLHRKPSAEDTAALLDLQTRGEDVSFDTLATDSDDLTEAALTRAAEEKKESSA